MSHTVTIENAVKKYGDFVAVNGINVKIKQGEFFTLLGPSGCGKTTLLRMIAGFNTVDGGNIYFDDKVINNIDAHKRDIGMVFQNYAIFPHLTVFENVAYGLKAKKVPKADIERRVNEALAMVQITELKDRRPNALSGGQQQRVALARAVVIEPGVLLMDEPLSNLDAKLRIQMRSVIKKLQQRLGITTIYVTHDQEEALAISDRIAVMSSGNIMQVGTPEQVYRKPENQFVAGFIGVSNFMEVMVESGEGASKVIIEGGASGEIALIRPYNGKAILSARPEQLFFSESEGVPGTISFSTFLGDFIDYEIKLDNGQTVQLNEYTKDTSLVRKDGERVKVSFAYNKVSLYTQDGEDGVGEMLSC